MSLTVSDHRSNAPEQIEFAAKVINRSKDRLKVFEAIYQGKKASKSVEEIASKTGLSNMRVLQEAGKLASNGIVKQSKHNGKTIYTKDAFFATNKARIIKLAKNPKKLEKLVTKRNPAVRITSVVQKFEVPKKFINAKQITVDDIDSFAKVKKVKTIGAPTAILENKFKQGVLKIISETGEFKDWGGEKNDLLTTRVKIKGTRIPTAFAFKGRGKKGKLTPAKMGKNGDQIQRLFSSTASLYVLQYWDEIQESVVEQMEKFAQLKSVTESKRIYYCVIDGADTCRLLKAYPTKFK